MREREDQKKQTEQLRITFWFRIFPFLLRYGLWS